MHATFAAFFFAATGHEPYEYQRRLAGVSSLEGGPPGEPSASTSRKRKSSAPEVESRSICRSHASA
jgi:hypothetical protein